MKPYSHLPNYLLRFTIFRFKSIHIRIHKILSEDKTPFLHTHPFNYCSIILKGGYTEQFLQNDKLITVTHSTGSLIFRNKNIPHRISKIKNKCVTLFITWDNDSKWDLINHSEILKPKGYIDYPDGIHERVINNKKVFSKRLNGKWYIGNQNKEMAKNETRYSIHQI